MSIKLQKQQNSQYLFTLVKQHMFDVERNNNYSGSVLYTIPNAIEIFLNAANMHSTRPMFGIRTFENETWVNFDKPVFIDTPYFLFNTMEKHYKMRQKAEQEIAHDEAIQHKLYFLEFLSKKTIKHTKIDLCGLHINAFEIPEVLRAAYIVNPAQSFWRQVANIKQNIRVLTFEDNKWTRYAEPIDGMSEADIYHYMRKTYKNRTK